MTFVKKCTLIFTLLILQIYQLFSLGGQSSYPYLSGYTWAFFCDHRLVNDDYGSAAESFQPESVKLGDTIFVDFTCLERFARDYLPRLQEKVILITANYGYGADSPMPGPFGYLINEEKIAAWFLQNIDRECSEKLIPIPIGLASRHWVHGNIDTMNRFIPLAFKKERKSIFMYLNFTPRPGREDCIQYFRAKGAKILTPTQPFESYLEDLSETIFVISPPGNGQDCHRTWEALLMGCYPVVKSSPLNPLFENLPVVIVKEWNEVTDAFLAEEYVKLRSKRWSREKLYAPYWFQKVRDLQRLLREPSI